MAQSFSCKAGLRELASFTSQNLSPPSFGYNTIIKPHWVKWGHLSLSTLGKPERERLAWFFWDLKHLWQHDLQHMTPISFFGCICFHIWLSICSGPCNSCHITSIIKVGCALVKHHHNHHPYPALVICFIAHCLVPCSQAFEGFF